MFASPLSRPTPLLQLTTVPALPAITTDQPPALELYDVEAEADDDEDDDDDDDDDSSDGKLTTDVILSDDADQADGQPLDTTQPGEDGEDGGEQEEEDDEEEEVPEPCPRFYIRIKQFGPYINYNTLVKHAHSEQQPAVTATQPHSATLPPNLPTATPAAAAAAGAAGDTVMAVDAVGAAAAAASADDEGDVQIVGSGRTRRKRQSLQDEYDTADPFIDDTELPQEREEEEMRTEIEGFHVQIGAVQVREKEVVVKLEGAGQRTRGGRRERGRSGRGGRFRCPPPCPRSWTR